MSEYITSPHGIRYTYESGTSEQCDRARNSELYELGDMRLIWVNEGDLLFSDLQSQLDEVVEALEKIANPEFPLNALGLMFISRDALTKIKGGGDE